MDRRSLETILPATLPLRNIRDLQGIVVARGNDVIDLYIVGSATNWNLPQFPAQAQNIARALGIPENTISLWIHGPLAERMAYTYAATHQHTK